MLLHGAEKTFPSKDTKSSPASGNANTKHVSTNAAVGDIHSQELTKGLLPVASPVVSADATITNALALCDSASLHSWVSADLVKRLQLVGTPVNLIINGFNSTSLMKTQQVSFQVSAETNKINFRFLFELMLRIIFVLDRIAKAFLNYRKNTRSWLRSNVDIISMRTSK